MEYQREALSLARALDSRGEAAGFVALTLSDLGSTLFALGMFDEAVAAFEEAIDRRQITNQSWGAATAFVGLGYAAAARGERRKAFAALTEGLAHAVTDGDRRLQALALAGIGILAVAWDQPRIAVRLLSAADVPEARGLPLGPAYRPAKERAIAACRAMLDEAAFATAWAAGQVLGLDEAAAKAVALTPPETDEEALPAAPKLSPRETEVLRLIVEGRTDREIGEALFISHRTAMTHVSNILAKLGVESRTAAAARAVRDKLV